MRRELAFSLAAIQDKVITLRAGSGYGYARSLEGPFKDKTWSDVIARSLARSRRWIEDAGHFDPVIVDAVSNAARGFTNYFESIAPTPFLHDITTKNVIVADGKLSGIVDVDDLCFGDPLYLLGLINMALLAHEFDSDYLDFWKNAR